MTLTTLQAQLEPIARAYRQFQLWRGLTLCWGWATAIAIILLVLYRLTGWWASALLPVLVLATGGAALVVWWRARKNAPAHRWIAQQIELENPKLRTLLLAAVEQQPDQTTGALNYLQERVVLEALAANQKQPWVQKHIERVFFAQCSQWLTLFALVTMFGALTMVAPRGRTLLGLGRGVTISPGDATVERGSSFVILARFRERMPAEAVLVVNSIAEKSRRITLAKNLEDPVFGGSIPEVNADLTYHVEYDELRTADYKVKVFDFPALRRADAELKFPEYTGQPAKKIEDTRRISAVEGTVVDYAFQLNKPVASAKLVAKDKSVLPLVADNTKSNVYLAKLTLEQTRHYELQLVDDAGRTNKTPSDIVINVLPNRAPEIKLTFPRQDIRVSPLEELALQAQASDDFGLRAYGIAYTMAGKETKFVELGQSTQALEKRPLTHLLSLEDLSAEPDQLLTYYIWADDLGPDGQVRRTSSDMYFAEVRPFEEIFREGQQPPSNESQQNAAGGQPSQTEKLAELQKQIINATWKLQRRETAAKPTANYKKDVVVVKESQDQALKQAEEMKSRMENPRFKPLIETVLKEMKRATENLDDAADKNSAKPLPGALNAEQSAYQALLKLQAREFEVTRSRNQRQSGQAGSQRNQQQLDQLELKQSENRYETQRQAAQQQNPEQREQLQVLNRLKELAQRQQDVNERLKELQTALQEAKTEAEREAVRRQLKRLREEEQEILANVDELRQRMDRQENQSQMAEARQQLDQTRSEVRRASEELDKEAVSQALASGTRAQRDFQQLRDDFRKKSSSQFSEEMRQMRSDARQLAQKEEEIGREIDAMSQTQRKSLSDSAERKQLAEQLTQQQGGLTNLLNNMRQVTEQAETAEPLLSRQLYDTIRKTDQSKFSRSVTNASELLQRGFLPQASQLERQARPIIDEVKQGVERAAESVLGDEAEALRIARNELDDLSRQLDEEIARSDTNALASAAAGTTPAGQPQTPGSDQNSSAQSQPSPQSGNQQTSGQQSGNQQASSQQPGNQQGAGQQPGNQQASAQNNSGQRSQPGPGSQPSPGNQQGNAGQASANQNGNQQNQTAQNAQGQRGGNQPGGDQPGQAAGGNRGGGQQQQASNQQQGPGPRRSLSGPNPYGGQRAAQNQRGQRGGPENFFEGGAASQGGGTSGPLTGNDFTNWSDRLRDVEEMVDIPEIRNRIAQIRDRARGIRAEYKRHSKEPQWALVKTEIATPLAEVRSRINEELARRASNDSLVPIDRDPVPNKYSELVRRYYEKLGSSE